MINNKNIVVTMSSWKKRIHCVAQTYYHFYTTQTVKPDLMYLTLSEVDFPNKENDLPLILKQVISALKINLIWQKEDNKIYKRYSVYPKHWNDYVLVLDDDDVYSPTLIQDQISILRTFPTAVCAVWSQFMRQIDYNNSPSRILLEGLPYQQSIRYGVSGKAMIPPRAFPLEMQDDSLKYLWPKFYLWNDEPFMTAFYIKNNIQQTFIPKVTQYRLFNDSQIVNGENIGMSVHFDNANIDDGHPEIKLYDKQLYVILRKLNMIDKYKTIFPKYNCDILDNCDFYKDI